MTRYIVLEREKRAEGPQTRASDIWLPIIDTYRTICTDPSPESHLRCSAFFNRAPQDTQ